eukprot:scaffold31629_cov68-Attheya_sp.AAC.3
MGNGNETDVPKDMTFSSVVSRELVKPFFLIAALNDLDVLSADIQHVYLNAYTMEHVYVKAVDATFGPDTGCPSKIVRTLHGLCSSRAHCRDRLAAVLHGTSFVGSMVDNDVWMKPAAPKPNGTKYYEYVATYVDDILCCSVNPQHTMDRWISKSYTLKADSVKEPDLYLGVDVLNHYIPE